MNQHYSDPERESETYALPDLEVWEDSVVTVECECGDYDMPQFHAMADGTGIACPSCETFLSADKIKQANGVGWFYWFCFPGCLPDSDVHGPFSSESEALEDAREG